MPQDLHDDKPDQRHGHSASHACQLVTRRSFLAGMGSFVAVMACAGTSIAVFKGGPTNSSHAIPGADRGAVARPTTWQLPCL